MIDLGASVHVACAPQSPAMLWYIGWRNDLIAHAVMAAIDN